MNMIGNREWGLNSLSDAEIPISINAGHKISFIFLIQGRLGEFYEPALA